MLASKPDLLPWGPAVCVWEDAGVQSTRARSQVAVNESTLAAAA